MDGTKMSKSKGNLIAPEHYFDTVGADGAAPLPPLRRARPSTTSTGPTRPSRSSTAAGASSTGSGAPAPAEPCRCAPASRDRRGPAPCARPSHRTIADVTNDLERWSYNTAVAHCMELLNLLQRYGGSDAAATADGNGDAARPHADVWDEALDALLLLLAPMAPHVTAELWERRHPGEPSVHLQPWPDVRPRAGPPGDRDDGGAGQRQGARPHRGRRRHLRGRRRGGLALASAKVIDALAGRDAASGSWSARPAWSTSSSERHGPDGRVATTGRLGPPSSRAEAGQHVLPRSGSTL